MLTSREEPTPRTLQQNKALWLWCEMVATTLNESGNDMKRTLTVDIPWSKDTVMQYLYKPVMEAQVMKDSTKDLSTKEVSEIAETLIRMLGERTGIEAPNFPSIDDVLHERTGDAKD